MANNVTNGIPVRLQRSRRKGARLVSPNGLPILHVTRPGKWGNPFDTAEQFREALCLCLARPTKWQNEKYQRMSWIAEHLRDLRGKNLVCWCDENEACHGDILLREANR